MHIGDFVCRIGQSIEITGYAKNLPDGTVEIIIEGDEKKIALFSKRIANIKLALGVHVDDLKAVDSSKINRLTYPSFTAAY